MDMHSGGGLKEPPYGYIYIQAPEEEACVIFYHRFGHSPHRISCTCCGEDYSVMEYETLEDATSYKRRGTAVPLEEYEARENVLVIRRAEIKPDESRGEIPDQGWVWQD
jgi:hypothetical protein